MTDYFDISREMNYNRNREIGRLMGRKIKKTTSVVGVTMATDDVAEERNIYISRLVR